jgi:hypothetical protein
MSHHGNLPIDMTPDGEKRDRAMRELQRKMMGEYPDGRLNPDDAGAIAMAVSSEKGRVRLDFPKPVAWIGFTGDEAMQLAQDLMRHARHAGITTPVVIRLGE